MTRFVVEAAAKVNVGWRVGRKRDDGYHEVSGLMQTISIFDTLEITTGPGSSEGPLRLSCPGREDLEVPQNLVCVAASVLAEEVGSVPATEVVLRKRIPVAAGLGGGSADAAAALVGLNTAWKLGLSAKRLVEIAGEIGSDVPAILVGGLVHASGRGEVVRSVGSFDSGWLVLGVGREGVSAADAYGVSVASEEDRALHHNDLQAAACELVPDLAQRVEAMAAAAPVAYVSGSGPTVVGVFSDEDSARKGAEGVRGAFAGVHLAQPVPWGVRLRLRS